MAGELIEFVDSVSASAVVRLTLTTSPWSVLVNGTDVSPPPMRRAISSTLLADGDVIPATAYGNRTVTLHLELDSTSETTAATELQKLNRELDRKTNILRWQPDSAIPAVYFRTFRSPDYAQVTDHGINRYEFTVSVLAEPFALGLIEAVSPGTVNNDPAAGSNQKFMDISSVKGDVETPLIIKIPGTTVNSRQSLFSVRRRDTPSNMPMIQQAETCTMGTDTATSANDVAYSGSGNNTTRTTFSTVTTTTTRLSFVWPPSGATSSVDMRGTYRVFARCFSLASTGSFTLRLRFSNRVIYNPGVALTSVFAFITMVDLGLMQVPVGMDPETDGLSGTGLKVSPGQIPVAFFASRESGSGTLIVDYFMFVPADDRFSIVTWGNHPIPANVTYVFDGTKGMVYGVDSSNQVLDLALASFVGDAPMVSPGVTNRLVFVRDVSPAGVATVTDTVSSSSVLTISYYPRYLMVRPTST